MSKYKQLPLILIAFFAGSLLSIATTVVLAQTVNNTIYGCVKSNLLNGPNIRIISSTANCNANETALNWNIQGVPGPTGAPGPTGVPGASGSEYFGLPFICSRTDLSPAADKFKGKDFSYAIMHECSFGNVDLSGVIFKNATFGGSAFDNVNLSNGDFSNTFADGMHFTGGTNLTNATFLNASTNGIVMQDVNLQNVNFQGDNFSGADFTGAQNMDTANLTGVIWNNTVCPDGTNSDNDGGTCVGHF